jgi:hypothetical protein
MAKRKAPKQTNRKIAAKNPKQLSLFDLLPPTGASTPLDRAVKKARIRKPLKPAIERPAVLTPAEAALYLNIKPATLKSWRAKGIGPAFVKRAARLIGYTPAALDAYLAQTTPRKA